MALLQQHRINVLQESLPLQLSLHGFACGYNAEGNGKGNSDLFQELINQGFAVLAIDLFGCGTRIQEAQYFYQRFPKWSKMGKMVNDVSACIDALETMTSIDSKHIFVLGNTLGGSIGLIAAAQDQRIAIKSPAIFEMFKLFLGNLIAVSFLQHRKY